MADTSIVFADDDLTDRLPDPLFFTVDVGTVAVEYRQLRDAGNDLTTLESEFEALLTDSDAENFVDRANTLLDTGPDLPERPGYGYEEPTALPDIQARTPPTPDLGPPPTRDVATDAIHGGWLGACAGCLLGKPVQGWSRDRIHGFLTDSDQAPLASYMEADVPEPVADRYAIHRNLEPIPGYVDQVDGMPIDDDIDYLLVGVEALNRHGLSVDSLDIATTWLDSLPLMNTYTAERIAYRNLTNGITPPESATERNPYREMIGALIRADPWGYVSLGDLETAAALAHRDARISHIKNGVYGEMWAAAMIAAAPIVDSVEAVIDAGLSQIPTTSRLAHEVDLARRWVAESASYEAVVDRIHDRWDETTIYDWVHTLSNAQIIVAALEVSDGAFGDAICRAVEAGFDTDSHAATIGSILGAYHGAQALPRQWVDPLDDTVASSLPGRGQSSIASLATATTDHWAEHGPTA